jgi:hypothetical protein
MLRRQVKAARDVRGPTFHVALNAVVAATSNPLTV